MILINFREWGGNTKCLASEIVKWGGNTNCLASKYPFQGNFKTPEKPMKKEMKIHYKSCTQKKTFKH